MIGDGPAGRDRFVPSRDGFRFANSWPVQAAVRIRTPFGAIGIGNAANGLCGGMVFAARDYWQAGMTPPAEMPEPGAPLYGFIVRRLLESWQLPGGVARYYAWMNLPDVSSHGVRARSVSREWPRIMAELDAGAPVPVGVVTVGSANPLLLGHNHQVLAYRYLRGGGEVQMYVYDPNSGPRDDVCISFGERFRATPGPAFGHNLAVGWPVRGFFRTGYRPATPPGLASSAEICAAPGSD